MNFHTARSWTDEAILDALRTYEERHGVPPTSGRWRYAGPGHPCSMTVEARFGTFADACWTAGIPPPRRGYAPRWTCEAIVEAFRAWHARTGSWPQERDWPHATPEHPNVSTVRRRFGRWRRALRAAGLVGPPFAYELRDAERDRLIIEAARTRARRAAWGPEQLAREQARYQRRRAAQLAAAE